MSKNLQTTRKPSKRRGDKRSTRGSTNDQRWSRHLWRLGAIGLALALLTSTISSSPAAAQSTREEVLFDFSNDRDKFWVHQVGDQSTIRGAITSGGKQRLSIALQTGRDRAWAGKHPRTNDWSSYDTVRFDFHGAGTNSDVSVELLEGPDRERFVYTFKDNTTDRRVITIPFAGFTRVNGGQAAGRHLVDVTSFRFAFSGPNYNGRILIDNVKLTGGTRPPNKVTRRNDATTRPDPSGGSLQLGCAPRATFKVADPIGNTNHLHMFVGNLNVTATSNNSLGDRDDINFSPGTECPGGGANLSGYWVPALLDRDVNGNVARLRPTDVNIYYKRGQVNSDAIQPFPSGLQIVVGQEDTIYRTVTEWQCFTAENGRIGSPQSTIPTCAGNQTLKLVIYFPQCVREQAPWDPQFPRNGACPSSHITVPEVNFQFHWDNVASMSDEDPRHLTPNGTPERTTRDWYLSSDPQRDAANSPRGSTLHGDWMNGWHPDIMQSIVDNCIKQSLLCINQISRTEFLVN